MKPTIKDIARSTGLSVATVSRALHDQDSPYVSEQTRRRVREAALEMGYRPNQMGRALVTGRTNTVGLWTLDAFTPYYSMVARSVSDLATHCHYRLAVQSVAESTGVPHEDSHRLRWQVDGILACDVALYGSSLIAALRSERALLVEMGIHHAEQGDYVGVDLYSTAVQAVQHLVAPGCRRIAYLVNTRTLAVQDPRNCAYQDVLSEAGLKTEYILLPIQDRALARQTIQEHIQQHGCPDAIFCVNDLVAIGCYRGLCDLGLRIPEDVALLGCDGLEDTAYYYHPLSTIVQPVEEMCRLAWNFLESRLQDPTGPRQQAVLRPRLEIRGSSNRG